jgi:hypothetical protein
MKSLFAAVSFFLGAWLFSGCAGFGFTEFEDAVPVEKGKLKIIGALELSPGVGNELVAKKYIADTVKYGVDKIYKQSNSRCLLARASGVFGISNVEALSLDLNAGIFPRSVGLQLGYRRLLMNSASDFFSGYARVGYTKVLNYSFYYAGYSNDEDGTTVNFRSDIMHLDVGVVYTRKRIDDNGNTSILYCGTTIRVNQSETKVSGGVEYFMISGSNYHYNIFDVQKHTWVVFIPYGGFSLGSKGNNIVGFSLPIWYDSILKEWTIMPSMGFGISGLF